MERVIGTDELQSGERRSVFVDDIPALVIRIESDYFVIEDVCSHGSSRINLSDDTKPLRVFLPGVNQVRIVVAVMRIVLDQHHTANPLRHRDGHQFFICKAAWLKRFNRLIVPQRILRQIRAPDVRMCVDPRVRVFVFSRLRLICGVRSTPNGGCQCCECSCGQHLSAGRNRKLRHREGLLSRMTDSRRVS